jgi:hypothetical protein
MNLIKLSQQTPPSIWINPRYVVDVQPAQIAGFGEVVGNATVVSLANGKVVAVDGEPPDTAKLLGWQE